MPPLRTDFGTLHLLSRWETASISPTPRGSLPPNRRITGKDSWWLGGSPCLVSWWSAICSTICLSKCYAVQYSAFYSTVLMRVLSVQKKRAQRATRNSAILKRCWRTTTSKKWMNGAIYHQKVSNSSSKSAAVQIWKIHTNVRSRLLLRSADRCPSSSFWWSHWAPKLLRRSLLPSLTISTIPR